MISAWWIIPIAIGFGSIGYLLCGLLTPNYLYLQTDNEMMQNRIVELLKIIDKCRKCEKVHPSGCKSVEEHK